MSDEQVEHIIVTIDDQHIEEIQSVANALQTEGMKVNNIMSITGIITGEVSKTKFHNLKAVPGVVDIEEDQEMQAIYFDQSEEN